VGADRVTTLTRADLTAGTELDVLLANDPVTTWKSIIVYRDGTSDTTQWLEPAKNYADDVPLVFLAGDRPAIAMFAPGNVATRANAVVEVEDISAIRIEIEKHKRTAIEEVEAGCQPEPKGELPPPPPARRWRGRTFQFNMPVHWDSDLDVDLGQGPLNAKVGTLDENGVEMGDRCHYDLFRMRNRNGRRAVFGKLRSGDLGCVDGIYELTCTGRKLSVLGYYANGTYVGRGILSAVPVK